MVEFQTFCEHNNTVAIQGNNVGTSTIFSYNDTIATSKSSIV